MGPHLVPRKPGRFVVFLAFATAAPGLSACYDSYPTPLGGDATDALDAREAGDDAAADDATEVTGLRFDPDIDATEAPGTLWLAEEAATGSSITLRLMVDAAPPAFGVAARLRWDAARVALRNVRSCGPFDRGGTARLEWKVVEPAAEAWLGLAAPSREDLVPIAGGTCALLADFDILGPGTSRIELVAGRSAAVGSPPTRYLTTEVGGGTLEVTR